MELKDFIRTTIIDENHLGASPKEILIKKTSIDAYYSHDIGILSCTKLIVSGQTIIINAKVEELVAALF
jgi:hypothetical protein